MTRHSAGSVGTRAVPWLTAAERHFTLPGDDPMIRGSRILVMLALTLLTGACTASSPAHSAPRRSHLPASVSHTGRKNTSALADEGLLVPATYQAACTSEGSICPPHTTGTIPAILDRPLHLPVLRPGQSCPASPGRPVKTEFFGGIALGTRPVRVVIAGAGDLRHGVAVLINPTSSPP
jgi:hypothetical protein